MHLKQRPLQFITVPALVTVVLLLIPLLAMQFTDQVNWTPFDFIVAGTLLFVTGLMYKLMSSKSATIAYSIAAGFALFSGLFLIWSNLAVGMIGSENQPVNTLYLAVIAIGLVGGFVSNIQPRGMVLTMFAMALTQALITAGALLAGVHHASHSSTIEVTAINGLFFLHAAKQTSNSN